MKLAAAAPKGQDGKDLIRILVRDPVLIVWALYLMSIPFYVGDSGLPQPGNALLILLIPLALRGWNGRLQAAVLQILRPLALFTLWVFLVNFTWALIQWKWGLRDYVLHPFYYAFNAVMFFTAQVLYQRHGQVFIRITGLVITAMVGFLVVASLFRRGDLRGTLWFNNPNQLGYYALLAACLVSLVQRPARISLLTASIALTGCTYLSILSASRAATAGIGILFVLLVFSNPRLIALGVIAAVALLALGGPIADSMSYTEQRRILIDRDKETSFIEERNYNRLWEYKEHLLVGAGEGDFQRFTETDKEALEIHSSAATVVFSYGIVGTVLFLMFALRVVKRAHLRVTVMLVPTFAYTIAHQGLRFTMLWVLLALFVACKLHAGSSRRPT
ncbi:MAG: hypothetical protein H0T42_16810 [Deltaproteobacteria bacterium]|nr:hypothetical protein [Deltaproteobacteria bacterium]